MKKMRSESPAIKRREEERRKEERRKEERRKEKSDLPMMRYLSRFETVDLVGNELVVVALAFVASA